CSTTSPTSRRSTSGATSTGRSSSTSRAAPLTATRRRTSTTSTSAGPTPARNRADGRHERRTSARAPASRPAGRPFRGPRRAGGARQVHPVPLPPGGCRTAPAAHLSASREHALVLAHRLGRPRPRQAVRGPRQLRRGVHQPADLQRVRREPVLLRGLVPADGDRPLLRSAPELPDALLELLPRHPVLPVPHQWRRDRLRLP